MEKHESKSYQVKQAIMAFVLSFAFVILLLTAQFLWKYNEDIFYKHLDFSIMLEITLLAMLNMVSFALPISILVTATVYYRNLFIKNVKHINMKGGLFYSLFFSVFCFFWIAFIAPANNTSFYGLLYDIRCKFPDKPIDRSDSDIFIGSVHTSDYFQLGKQIDLIKSQNRHKKLTSEQYSEYIQSDVVGHINSYQIERMKMIGFPILTLILFYFGMFLGIINRNNKLTFLLAGIYLIIIPGIYFLSYYFEKLARETTLTPMTGQLSFLFILILLTLGLFLYAKKHLKTNN